MKKFHIAIGVSNVEQSIVDYSLRLEQEPQLVIKGEYALWRTGSLNFSIRKTMNTVGTTVGTIRHLGWEDSDVITFTKETDSNGIVWEKFNED
jgi:uncharacterized protein YunC (DUF1805 family)